MMEKSCENCIHVMTFPDKCINYTKGLCFGYPNFELFKAVKPVGVECTLDIDGEEKQVFIDCGKSALKEEGKKYDTGKPRLGEMIIDFAFSLSNISKVWEFGANKYEKSNWKKVENAKDRYTNAMIRHLVAEETEQIDQETKLHHCLHVARNAIARVYFILKED